MSLKKRLHYWAMDIHKWMAAPNNDVNRDIEQFFDNKDVNQKLIQYQIFRNRHGAAFDDKLRAVSLQSSLRQPKQRQFVQALIEHIAVLNLKCGSPVKLVDTHVETVSILDWLKIQDTIQKVHVATQLDYGAQHKGVLSIEKDFTQREMAPQDTYFYPEITPSRTKIKTSVKLLLGPFGYTLADIAYHCAFHLSDDDISAKQRKANIKYAERADNVGKMHFGMALALLSGGAIVKIPWLIHLGGLSLALFVLPVLLLMFGAMTRYNEERDIQRGIPDSWDDVCTQDTLSAQFSRNLVMDFVDKFGNDKGLVPLDLSQFNPEFVVQQLRGLIGKEDRPSHARIIRGHQSQFKSVIREYLDNDQTTLDPQFVQNISMAFDANTKTEHTLVQNTVEEHQKA